MTVKVAPNTTGSHRFVGQAEAVLTSTREIHVSPEGSDTVWNGSQLFPFATIAKAFANVTSARKIIRLAPGEYDETGLTWPTISGVQLIGVGNRFETVIKDSAEGDEVLAVAPGVQTSTWEMTIQNIHFDHDNSGQDGIKLTHTDVAAKMNIYLGVVGFDGDSSDLAILVVHGGSGNAVRIYWDSGNGDCESAIDLDSEDDGDRFYADNVIFKAGIDAGAADTTQDILLRNCQVLANAAFSGGGATGVCTLLGCWSLTGTTYAPTDMEDVTTASSLTDPVVITPTLDT